MTGIGPPEAHALGKEADHGSRRAQAYDLPAHRGSRRRSRAKGSQKQAACDRTTARHRPELSMRRAGQALATVRGEHDSWHASMIADNHRQM